MPGPYTYTSLTGSRTLSTPGSWTGGQGSDYPGKIYAITGAANNGSGLIRLTISSTATFATGDVVNVRAVVGTTEANAQWTVSVVDGTHLDLQGSTFANAYVSGGTLARNDKIVIAGNVTCDVDIDFGTNPSDDTPALVINAGGASNQSGRTLALAAGVRMRCRGPVHDLQPRAIGITFGAGSGIEIDPTYASPSPPWKIRVASAYDGGQTYPNATARGWRFNGTTGSRCFLMTTPNGGTKNAYMDSLVANGENCFQGSYVDFVDIGDASRRFWAPRFDNRGLSSSLSNATITNCGELSVNFESGSGDSSFTLTDVVQSATRCDGTTTFPLNLGSSADATTGTRGMTRCVWSDKTLKFTNAHAFFINICFVNDGWVGSGNKVMGLVSGSFLRQRADNLYMPCSADGNYALWDGEGGDGNGGAGNPHGWAIPSALTAGATAEWKNNVFEYTGSSAAGNMFIGGSFTTVFTWSIHHNLILPNGANLTSGTLATVNGTAVSGFLVKIYANTACVAGQHGLEIGHGATVADLRYDDVLDNLLFGTGAATGYKGFDTDGIGVANFIPPAKIHNNAGYLITTLPTGNANYAGAANGWYAKFTGGSPDANSLDGVNPGFVDPTRNLATWAVTRGSTAGTPEGKRADAMTYLKADPTLIGSSLIPHVTGGFYLTSAAYANTNTAGTGPIGAFPLVLPVRRRPLWFPGLRRKAPPRRFRRAS